jgi:hypothetical protein
VFVQGDRRMRSESRSRIASPIALAIPAAYGSP